MRPSRPHVVWAGLLFIACGGRSAPGWFIDDDPAAGTGGAGNEGSGGTPSSSGGRPGVGGSSTPGAGGGTGGSSTSTGGSVMSTGATGGTTQPPPGMPPPIDRLAQYEPAFVRGFAVDRSNGALYVAGYTWISLFGTPIIGGKDAYLASFSAVDRLDWFERIGSNGEEGATSLLLSSTGILYVGGHTDQGVTQPVVGQTDVFVRSFDTTGAAQNVSELGSVGDDSLEAIFETAEGQLFLAGYAGGQIGGSSYAGDNDAFVAELSPTGAIVWMEQFGTSGDDRANDLVVTDDGSIFVTGYTDTGMDGTGHAGGFDGFLMRLHPGGALDWVIPFATPEDDFVSGLALGPGGTLYVFGRTLGELGVSSGGSDAFVAAVEPSGDLLWLQQVGTRDDELVFDLEVSALGDIYLGGLTNGQFAGYTSEGEGDAFVTKLNALGLQQWSLQFGSSANDRAMRLDSTDKLYVAGESAGPLTASSSPDGGIYLLEMPL